MTLIKSMPCRFSTCLSVSAVLAFYLGSPLKAVGQSIEPPPGQGSPNGTIGGGSRSSSSFCPRSPQSNRRLMAVSPKGQIAHTSVDRPGF